MKNKTSVKVIKRDEREAQEKVKQEVQNPIQSKQELARHMVQNVTMWVNEFQQKRRSETSIAIKNLFTEKSPNTGKA